MAALDVANPNQWLLYFTENAVSGGGDANLTDALVQLATDLGLQSNSIRQYAFQHNLVEAAVALQPEVMISSPATPEAVAAASQADVVSALGNGSGNVSGNSDETTSAETSPEDTSTAENSAPEALSAGLPSTVVTSTSAAPTVAPTPTSTPVLDPQVKAASDINVRLGPGIDYTIAGALQQNETASITGKNPVGDWWEVLLTNGQRGWVYAPLVETTGDTNAIAVAVNIPTPPPTATPAPTQPPAPPAEAPAPPVEEPAAAETPAVDPNGPPHFTLVSRRLWGKQENDGCVGKHLLRIHVLDANGGRLNGVRLKGIYTGYELVTGDQGKGDGIIEFDLHGTGEGFTVVQNNDGREATSDRAEGFTTRSVDIDKETLINTGYCTNDEDCQVFYNSWGCQGHHSWEAIFQRNY
ncbi:MAG: SH3 domain-containing protein [Caldilineaceae bacterium]